MEPLIEMLQALIDDANAYLEDCKSEGDRETIRAADDYAGPCGRLCPGFITSQN